MRFAAVDGRAALVTDDTFLDLESASGGALPAHPLAALDTWSSVVDFAVAPEGDWQPLDLSRLGSPVGMPRQVFALAANYRDHAAEAGIEPPATPYVFTKFPTSVCGPFDDIVLGSNRCDWEVELVVVIGRAAYRVAAEQAWDVVAGLTIGQDVSDRRVQFRKPFPHLSISKSAPTYSPVGPWITTLDEVADRDDLAIRCAIDETTMQDSRTSQLVFGVPELIAEISAHVALTPGDLIFTGTPAGVGSTRDPRRYLEPGQVVTSEIEALGTMRNRCTERT